MSDNDYISNNVSMVVCSPLVVVFKKMAQSYSNLCHNVMIATERPLGNVSPNGQKHQ